MRIPSQESMLATESLRGLALCCGYAPSQILDEAVIATVWVTRGTSCHGISDTRSDWYTVLGYDGEVLALAIPAAEAFALIRRRERAEARVSAPDWEAMNFS